MSTILFNVLDLFLCKSLLLFEFLASIKTSIVACRFRFFKFLKSIRECLFRVKCFRKNYKKKLIYNTYRTRQALEFAIEIAKISIIIK